MLWLIEDVIANRLSIYYTSALFAIVGITESITLQMHSQEEHGLD